MGSYAAVAFPITGSRCAAHDVHCVIVDLEACSAGLADVLQCLPERYIAETQALNARTFDPCFWSPGGERIDRRLFCRSHHEVQPLLNRIRFVGIQLDAPKAEEIHRFRKRRVFEIHDRNNDLAQFAGDRPVNDGAALVAGEVLDGLGEGIVS